MQGKSNLSYFQMKWMEARTGISIPQRNTAEVLGYSEREVRAEEGKPLPQLGVNSNTEFG